MSNTEDSSAWRDRAIPAMGTTVVSRRSAGRFPRDLGRRQPKITFGPSNQSITFTGNGASSVAVSSPTLTGSAFDTERPSRKLHAQCAVLYGGSASGGIFSAAANTETFTYTNPDGDTRDRDLACQLYPRQTPHPSSSARSNDSLSGDAAFLAAFGPVGQLIALISEMPLTCPCRQTARPWTSWPLHDSASAPISSGEKSRADPRARISRASRQCVIRAGLAWPTSGQAA